MQYAWTKVTVCVETILINTIASSLQALACHIDTHRKHNLACLVSEEHQRLFVKDEKKGTNVSSVIKKNLQMKNRRFQHLQSLQSVFKTAWATTNQNMLVRLLHSLHRSGWPVWFWWCRPVCPHRLCGGAEVCDGQPGPAGSHTHASVLSLPPDQAAQPEDLTAPPAPPSPPLSLPRSLVVPQSWAHHGRMLLQTQTR